MAEKLANRKTHRVAVVQAAPVVFDSSATIERIGTLVSKAARKKAELVLFPEAFVSGYPKGSVFGSFVGGRTAEGRDLYLRYWESAVEVPGPEFARLAKIAAKNKIYLVVGVIERDGGTLYCCVLFFGSDGTFLGKHRKLMPTGCERLAWGFGDGSTMPVFKTAVGRVGAVICWENYMPLMRMAMYGKNIQIYCAPTADERDSWIATMRHVAVEGRCFVLSCNQFTRRKDFPADFKTRFGTNPEKIISRGGSCIIDPFGNFLDGPVFDKEDILVADLDLGDIIRGKFDFDVTGHYARPDVFSLLVNEEPENPVRLSGKGKG